MGIISMINGIMGIIFAGIGAWILWKSRHSIRNSIEQYASMAGMPAVPPAKLDDIKFQGVRIVETEDDLLRLAEAIYDDEEALKYLLVHYQQEELKKRVEYARDYQKANAGMSYDAVIGAAFHKFPSFTRHAPMRAILIAVLRAITFGIGATIMALFVKGVNVEGFRSAFFCGLLMVSLQSAAEYYFFNKMNLLSRFADWIKKNTDPGTRNDLSKLGERYLKGFEDATVSNMSKTIAKSIYTRVKFDKSPSIELGISSGELKKMGISGSLSVGATVRYSFQSMCTGTMIIGGTGIGKTTAVILQMLAKIMVIANTSILAFDVKKDLQFDIFTLFQALGIKKKLAVIGDQECASRFNLIDRKVTTPEQNTEMLGDFWKMSGEKMDFWLVYPLVLFWASMHLLDILNEHRSMATVVRCMYNEEYREGLLRKLDELDPKQLQIYIKLGQIKDKEAAEDEEGKLKENPLIPAAFNAFFTDKDGTNLKSKYIASYLNQDIATGTIKLEAFRRILRGVFARWKSMAEQTKTGLEATIDSKLMQFDTPLFSNFTSETDISLADLLSEDCLYIVDVPKSLGDPGRLIRYFLFKQAYATTLSRLHDKSLNQDRQVFLVADECQQITNSASFADSDTARSAKLAVIAATQSLSQLLKTWGGKDEVYTILANFRTYIGMSTDDPESRDFIKKRLGEQLILEYSYSVANTKGVSAGGGAGAMDGAVRVGQGDPFHLAKGMGVLGSQSYSKTNTSTVNVKKGPVYDEFLDSLGGEQALVILNDNNARRKSLVDLTPLYLNKSKTVQDDLIAYLKSRQTANKEAAKAKEAA